MSDTDKAPSPARTSSPGPITVGGITYAHAVDNAIDVRQPSGAWRRAIVIHYEPIAGAPPGYLVVYPDDPKTLGAYSVFEPDTRARGIREDAFRLRRGIAIKLCSFGIWLVGERKGAK
jgi:hypothetical protein